MGPYTCVQIGTATAEHGRAVKTTSHRKITAAAVTHAAEAQHGPGRQQAACPQRQWLAVCTYVDDRARHRDYRILMKTQRRTAERHLQRSLATGITHQRIGELP